MKAAQIIRYGGQEVMEIRTDVAKPAIKNDEVLVEVYAAGVNPFDVKVREGFARQMAELDFPAILGGDFSGIVSEIGENVKGISVGQAVYGQAGALSGHGSFAEYTPVRSSQLALKPDSVDFTTAAALPLVSVSAYQALVDHMNVQKGQKILIHGGAGGIGSMVIQIAKYLGAYVTTTVTAGDIDFAKSLGADEAIDYTREDFSKALQNYDAVFDTVGGETNKKSYLVLKSGGSLVSMVEQPDEQLVKKYNINYVSQFTQVTTERLNAVGGLVDGGALKPIIDRIFPFDKADDALEYQKTGQPKGKVVIQMRES